MGIIFERYNRDSQHSSRWLFSLCLLATLGCNARVYSLGAGLNDDEAIDAGSAQKIVDAAAPDADAGCPHLDFQTVTQLASQGTDGTPGNGASFQPAVSADGRIVVFTSLADNLVPGDTNGVADVFAYDRDTGKVTLISADASGSAFSAASSMPAISPDASRIALSLPATNLGGSSTGSVIALTKPGIDVNQFVPGLTAVSPLNAPADSINPVLANGASLLVFQSQAANLVAGDTNNRDDFFTFRPGTGSLARLVTAGDDPAFVIDNCRPKLNPDGSALAFCGHLGTAPKNVSMLHLGTNTSEWVGTTPTGALSSGACYAPALSAAGDAVAFICDGSDLVAGDTNGQPDAFVRDMRSGTTRRISFMDDGTQSAQAAVSVGMSGDGRWVLYLFGNGAPADMPPAYGGVTFYDRHCGNSRNVFISTDNVGVGTDINGIGSVMRIDDISLSYDGSTLVGTVTNVQTADAVSQVILIKIQWPQ